MCLTPRWGTVCPPCSISWQSLSSSEATLTQRSLGTRCTFRPQTRSCSFHPATAWTFNFRSYQLTVFPKAWILKSFESQWLFHIAQCATFKTLYSAHTVHLYVLYGSWNTQHLFPCASNKWKCVNYEVSCTFFHCIKQGEDINYFIKSYKS